MLQKLLETIMRVVVAGAALAAFDLAGARAEAKPATMPFIVPVQAACVSSPFGIRHLAAHPQLTPFHNGIDLPAPVGSSVLAVGPGTVIRVQRKGLGGLEILIQHSGFIGVYSHLGSVAPSIAEGNRTVYGGQKIGTVGMTGMTFGPHLFFAMLLGDQAVDPARFLGVVPCGQQDEPMHPLLRLPTRVYSAAPVASIRRPELAVSAR